MQSRALFGLRDYVAARASIESAIEFQRASGEDVPGGWNAIRAASIRNLEASPADELVCVEETSANSLIPKEVCYTRAELEQMSDDAREWMRTGGDFGTVTEIPTIE